MGTDCAGHTQRDTATDNPANQAADAHPEINNPSQADHANGATLVDVSGDQHRRNPECREAVPDTWTLPLLISERTTDQRSQECSRGSPSPWTSRIVLAGRNELM